MKILITGGSGKLGSAVTKTAEEYGLDYAAPSSSTYDLRIANQANQMIKDQKPDIILHLASKVGGIEYNRKNQVAQLEVNSQIGLNVVSAAREFNVKRLVNVSSNCVYPVLANRPLVPEDIYRGRAEQSNIGFASAKLLTIEHCKLIDEDPDFHYKTLILSNLVGGRPEKRSGQLHLIDAAIIKMEDVAAGKSNKVTIFGTGKPLREHTHVNDASTWLIDNMTSIERWPSVMNLGSGEELSVLEVYELVASVIGKQPIYSFDHTLPDGIYRKLLDSSYAAKHFGWSPKINLETAIRMRFKKMSDS